MKTHAEIIVSLIHLLELGSLELKPGQEHWEEMKLCLANNWVVCEVMSEAPLRVHYEPTVAGWLEVNSTRQSRGVA